MSRAVVVASAPGKLVLSGEYAVLAGAPALVAAVDRRVTCTVTPRCSGGWQFASTGFEAQSVLSRAEVLRAPPTALAGIARRILPMEAMPAHLHVAVDSSPCFRAGAKLGVGSSAATVVALAGALAALGGDMPTLDVLYDIHAAFQGGGSGLDVAAATTGGVIRFQQRRIAPARLPEGLHVVFVFCRTSSRTQELVARFNAWRTRRAAQPRALAELVDAAQEVADCTGNADSFVAALREYAHALERMDRAAGIGVFGEGHRRAARIAARCGVAYKPCGAGGGDTGFAASASAADAAAFAREVEGAGLIVLKMEFSLDGLDVRSNEQG